MHPHEELTIRAFIAKEHQDAWLTDLADPANRPRYLDQLNKAIDFDTHWRRARSKKGVELAIELELLGAPATCRVMSDIKTLDGHVLPLRNAIEAVAKGGKGTILICIPGRLAYHYEEAGSREWILVRDEIA